MLIIFTVHKEVYIDIYTRIPEMLGCFIFVIKWKLKEFQITLANILFTIEHREHNTYLKWEILKCYAQNELI